MESNSRRSALRIVSLVVPIAALALALRLTTFSMMRLPGQAIDIGDAFKQNAPPALQLVLLGAMILIWIRHRWPHQPAVYQVSVILLLMAGILTVVNWTSSWWLGDWLSLQAFEFVRWDMLFLLCVGLFSFFVLCQLRGLHWTWVAGLLHLFILLLASLLTFEFGYFSSIGAPGGWSVLSHSIENLPQLLPLLGSSIQAEQLLMLLLPIGLSVAPLLIERISVVKKWIKADTVTLGTQNWHAWAPMLPLLALLVLMPGALLQMDQRHGLFPDLISDAVSSPHLGSTAMDAPGPIESQ